MCWRGAVSWEGDSVIIFTVAQCKDTLTPITLYHGPECTYFHGFPVRLVMDGGTSGVRLLVG